ncbi:hypothetical protein PFISCL1PPCAC_9515, partial [Pristionchus fissidentatus]
NTEWAWQKRGKVCEGRGGGGHTTCGRVSDVTLICGSSSAGSQRRLQQTQPAAPPPQLQLSFCWPADQSTVRAAAPPPLLRVLQQALPPVARESPTGLWPVCGRCLQRLQQLQQ